MFLLLSAGCSGLLLVCAFLSAVSLSNCFSVKASKDFLKEPTLLFIVVKKSKIKSTICTVKMHCLDINFVAFSFVRF